MSFTQYRDRPPAVPTPRSRQAPPLQIRTLGPDAFAAACGELARMVEHDHAPALLVGVRTGGLVVAETMARLALPPLPVLPFTCRRPSTAFKSGFPGLRPLLASLPEPLLNALRRAEHHLVSGHREPVRPSEISLSEAIAIGNFVRVLPRGARVLVVDDAVDSGVTLATVQRTLRATCPADVALRTAVITVTTRDPAVAPDYALYRGVLCRFPWSFDARN